MAARWQAAECAVVNGAQQFADADSEHATRQLIKSAVTCVAGIGVGLLQFTAAFIIAGIIMAFGEAGARSCRAIFQRIAAPRGATLTDLSTATIRAVAVGVIGVAFIQATLIGVALLIAGAAAVGRGAGARRSCWSWESRKYRPL